jgi:hypothetical protein
MNHVDPDIFCALKTVVADDSQRVLNVKARHQKQAAQRFETQMQLLADEVERVVPRTHPLFDLVLILAVARKIERTEAQKEREYMPDFERGFPAGW